MKGKTPPRTESEIFGELETLCSSPGYIHAIAFFCLRDNMIRYSGEMKPEDMRHLFSRTRLIRTETSTLIGLMLKHEIRYDLPSPEVMNDYVEKTEKLLEELHESMSSAFFAHLNPEATKEGGSNPFTYGEVLREAIFYGGESAYNFQYRDFSVRKYEKDDEWLETNKGFSIAAARNITRAVGSLLDEKGVTTLARAKRLPPDQWTFLPACEFSVEEVARRAQIDPATVERVLTAFTVPNGEKNQGFAALHDFNVAIASPLLRRDDTFILFNIYSLAEALYEAPFYWMGLDKTYVNTAMRNRGLFTEEFSVERLSQVFGKSRVHSNVGIYESKTKTVGEIDALVLFGNRAVVLQAKSKRLTLEARRGNDGQIRGDFKKSVQDSYDQGLSCAKHLLDRKHSFIDGDAKTVVVPPLKEVYILCVVADHYPALSFQARQFLKYETNDAVAPPFVLDVFTLDAMTEMLDSPLLLLSYIDRRVKYSEKLMASHELTILSFHLKQNLWLSKEHDLVMLEDGISTDLDLAMLARREEIPAKRTPDGILTRLKKTTLGRFVSEIESRPDPATISLGFFLLTIGEDSVIDISRGIDKLGAMGRADGKNHDMTVAFDTSGTGFTIHCNDDPMDVAMSRLENHATLRKYSQRAREWFGVCVHPKDLTLRFGINLDFPWEPNEQADSLIKNMPKSRDMAAVLRGGKRKIGRNHPCPCGSGTKYKKCCGKS